MPFYGQDWRSPGETWIRLGDTTNWERAKLRPIQVNFKYYCKTVFRLQVPPILLLD